MGDTAMLKNNPIQTSFTPKTLKLTDSFGGKEIAVRSSPNELKNNNLNPTSLPLIGNYMPNTKLSWSYFIHILFYINVGILFLSFFVNWDRTSFLSISLSIVYLVWYMLKEEYDSLFPMWFLLVGYFLTFLFDLLWVIYESKNLWNNPKYIHDASLSWVDKFMIIMSYVIIFFELAAVIVCALLQWKGVFTDTKESNIKPQMEIKF